MIAQTEKFIKGHVGKIMLYTLIFAILYTGYGCVSYRQADMDKSDFKTDKRIQASLAKYNFYVHDGDVIYKMNEVEFVNGKDLAGTLVPTTYEEPKAKKDWTRQERKEYWKIHRSDVHIYTDGSLNAMASTAAVSNSLIHERVILSDDMIKEIKIMVLDPNGDGEGYVDAVVAVALIIGILVALTIILVEWDDDSNSSGSGSDVND